MLVLARRKNELCKLRFCTSSLTHSCVAMKIAYSCNNKCPLCTFPTSLLSRVQRRRPMPEGGLLSLSPSRTLKWKFIRDHHLSHTHHYGNLLKCALQVNLFLLLLNCSAWPCLWVLLNYFLQTILCTSVRNSACGSGRRKKGRREVLFCKETQIYLITDSLSIGPTPSSERDHALRTSTKFLVFSAPSPLVQISLYTRVSIQ